MSTENFGVHRTGNVVHASFGQGTCNSFDLQSPRAVQQSPQKAEFVSFCSEISLSTREANAIWTKIHAADAELALAEAYFAATKAVARKPLIQEVLQKD